MGPVEEAVTAELGAMGPQAVASALGASTVDLARRHDEVESAAQAAQVAKEMRANLAALAERFPPAAEDDWVDELKARREREA